MNENIKALFLQALEDFLANEADLLDVDINERAISSKLALYLSKFFPNWNVDCEYNRLGRMGRKLIAHSKHYFEQAKAKGIIPENIKTFSELQKSEFRVAVYPDIIVHHRMHEFDNLLIIEIKKANNPAVRLGWDEYKINFFIDVLHYKTGVFVVFNTGDHSIGDHRIVNSIKWFN